MKFRPDADEYLPEEVLAAIEDGATPLTAVRQWMRMSVKDLAARSGVSVASIKGAEAGRELSPEAQVNIAWVLGVSADLFHQ